MSQAEDRQSEPMTAARARIHAEIADDDSRIIRALQEYQAALRVGHKPSRSEFQARYPEIAEALAECLDGLEFVHVVAPHLSDPGWAFSVASAISPEGPLGTSASSAKSAAAAWAWSTRPCKSPWAAESR